MKNQAHRYISIPTPCFEDWDNMTPQEKGRHCMKCNKVVLDFTSMSDDELLNYIKNSKEGVCGRVKDTQIHQSTPTYKIPQKLKVFLYSLAMAFLINIPLDTFAQTNIDTTISQTQPFREIIGKTTIMLNTFFNQIILLTTTVDNQSFIWCLGRRRQIIL